MFYDFSKVLNFFFFSTQFNTRRTTNYQYRSDKINLDFYTYNH